jgi:hypothetical protein
MRPHDWTWENYIGFNGEYTVLFLLSYPLDEVGDGFIFEHILPGGQFAAKLLFGELLMQEFMAVLTQVDALLHFVPGEPLFEPFVGVTEPGDKMMKRHPLVPATELTVLLVFTLRH